MRIDGIGSSVVIALAAVLWFVYLVPTWLRRREYLATERNAVRLQQTVRIIAESAELPGEVRAELSARSVAAQRRTARREQLRADAVQRAHDASVARAIRLAGQAAIPAGASAAAPVGSAAPRALPLAARRLRRGRLVASVVLLAAVIGIAFGIPVLLQTGAWALVAASCAVGFGAVALLNQMAAVSRARALRARNAALAPVEHVRIEPLLMEYDVAPSGWTPVPLPKPLYLSRPAPSLESGLLPPVESAELRAQDPAEELRAASAEAEQTLRQSQARPAVAPAPKPASRFASMGFVDAPDAAPTDLDAVLRRRRAVG